MNLCREKTGREDASQHATTKKCLSGTPRARKTAGQQREDPRRLECHFALFRNRPLLLDSYRRPDEFYRLKYAMLEERLEQVREIDGEQAYEKMRRAVEKASQEKASQEKARQVERASLTQLDDDLFCRKPLPCHPCLLPKPEILTFKLDSF